MAITSQQQRIPLVDLQTGLIRREWLAILFGNDDESAADIADLSAALAAALAQLAALQAQVDAIDVTESDSLFEQLLQPIQLRENISEMIFSPSESVSGAANTIGDGEMLANIAGAPAIAVGTTLSDYLDAVLGNTQGSLIYRGATLWNLLAPSTLGYVLTDSGPGGNPTWAPSGGGGSGSIDESLFWMSV